MSQTFGIEAPRGDDSGVDKQPARYLVLIESATHAARQARLFDARCAPLGDIDAGAPELQAMTAGLKPQRGAGGSEWDSALGGHSPEERAGAEVYTLRV